MLRVKCVLTDCVYFNKPTDPTAGPTDCDCAHAEKHLSVGAAVCPLYKKDWQKLNGAAALAKALRKRG